MKYQLKKKIVPALMLSILFLSTHTLPAQAPETPSDLPPPGPEYTGINENFGYDVVSRTDQMIQNNDQEGAMTLLTENFNGLTRLRVKNNKACKLVHPA